MGSRNKLINANRVLHEFLTVACKASPEIAEPSDDPARARRVFAPQPKADNCPGHTFGISFRDRKLAQGLGILIARIGLLFLENT